MSPYLKSDFNAVYGATIGSMPNLRQQIFNLSLSFFQGMLAN